MADALASGASGGNFVQVQVLFLAPYKDVTFETISEGKKPLILRGFLLYRNKI